MEQGVCNPDDCDAVTAPQHAQMGHCASTLASGAGCLPECDAGYVLETPTICSAGVLTVGVCEPLPWITDVTFNFFQTRSDQAYWRITELEVQCDGTNVIQGATPTIISSTANQPANVYRWTDSDRKWCPVV